MGIHAPFSCAPGQFYLISLMKERIRRFQLLKSYDFRLEITDHIRVGSLPTVVLFFETGLTIIRESEIVMSLLK